MSIKLLSVAAQLYNDDISKILQLQRILSTAARVIYGTRIFDRRLSAVRHSELHWPDIPDRIVYKLQGSHASWKVLDFFL